jgi:hypothetical protein
VAGDTIELEGLGPVTLTGIEVLERSQAAMEGLKAMVLDADVRLEFDPAKGAEDGRPRSAYVYRRDGTLVNGEMLRNGLALAKLDGSLTLSGELRAFEREAIEAKRGLWESPAGKKGGALTPLPPSAIGPNLPATLGPVIEPGPVVFVSADRRYHKTQGCGMMEGKKQTISLNAAKAGGYSPCSLCYPSPSQRVP